MGFTLSFYEERSLAKRNIFDYLLIQDNVKDSKWTVG